MCILYIMYVIYVYSKDSSSFVVKEISNQKEWTLNGFICNRTALPQKSLRAILCLLLSL